MSAPGLFDGEKLRAAQRESGISVVDLAEEIEVSRETLFSFMAGTSTPRVDKLTMLCLLMHGGNVRRARATFLEITNMRGGR